MTDAFGNSAEVRQFAPLLSFGSLRQLRDANGAAFQAYPEDATTTLLRPQIEAAVIRHAEDAADPMAATGVKSASYGRRAQQEEPLVPLGQLGTHHVGATTTIATTQHPLARHRGRKLFFLQGIIGKLISKALGTSYKSIEKEMSFDVPDTPRPHFFYDHTERQSSLVMDILRGSYCNPDHELTVEEAVGDPPPHATGDDLFDALTINQPYSLVTPASLRGGDVNGKYAESGASGGAKSYKDVSTQGWVYVRAARDAELGTARSPTQSWSPPRHQLLPPNRFHFHRSTARPSS